MKLRKWLAAALSAAMLLSLAACAGGSDSSSTPSGGSSAGSGSSTGSAASEEPYVITTMRPLYEAQPPAENSPAQLAVEEKLNIRFENRWVPTGTFTEVFNTTLATNDIPMVISAPSSLTVNPGFMKYCSSGVFWDLTDKIKNTQAFWDEEVVTQPALDVTAIEGRNYLFPLIAPAGRVAVVYRADWAEAVGAEPPTTVELFYEMAKKFTENDPDGNGQNDTYGFAYIDDADKELAYAGFTTIAVAKGAPNLWGEVDGKIVPYFETQEYMDTLNYFKDMYDNGYMNEDFYLIKGNDKYSPMLSGKAGMMMTSATNAATPGGKFDPLLTENPNAKIAYTNTFIQEDGTPITNSIITVGALGGLLFPQKSCTEEDVDRILDIFAQLRSDPELDKLISYGIEGTHYTMEGDTMVITDEQIELRKTDGSTDAFGSFIPKRILDKDYGQQLTPGQIITKEIAPNDKYALSDASAGKMDADMLSTMTSLATTISDARVKYILGQIDEEGFKAAVQSWKDAGGQEIIDKLNA